MRGAVWPRLISGLLIAGLALAGCRESSDEDRVVILVLDGVGGPESFGEGGREAVPESPQEILPTCWQDLVPNAARTDRALNLGVTVTFPAHVAMLSGLRQPIGHYPVSGGDPRLYVPELPGLLEAVRDDGGEVSILANAGHFPGLGRTRWPGADDPEAIHQDRLLDEDGDYLDDPDTLDALLAHLADRDVKLAVANLHHLDRTTHDGVEERVYPLQLGKLDEPLVAFWESLQELPSYADRTWLVVVADHGRHLAASTDPPWQNHGDQCAGCRRVPLMVLGPGVEAGASLETPVALADLGPTLAGLLGVSLPWADGRVARELFAGEGGPSLPAARSGVASAAEAGGHRVEQRYLDEAGHRSEIWLDGAVASDPDALIAEAPVLAADGDRAWACFREFVLDLSADEMPWRARCLSWEPGADTDGGAGAWVPLPEPETEIGPYWRPTILPATNGPVLFFVHNPDGATAAGAQLKVARYSDGGWSVASLGTGMTFPSGGGAAAGGDGVTWAFAGAGEDQHDRKINVGTVTPSGEWTRWSALSVDGDRLERPAVHVDDGKVWIAAIRHSGDGNALELAWTEGGDGWTRLAPPAPEPMPHLAPIWFDGEVVYAAIDGDEGAICRLAPGDEARCVDAGSPRVRSLAVGEDEVIAVIDGGEGEWIDVRF